MTTAGRHTRRGRASPAPTLAGVVTALVLVLTAHVAHAALISGCTVNDVTRIVEACSTGTTVVNLDWKSIHGFEADAFPAGSALTQLCVELTPSAPCTCHTHGACATYAQLA